MVNKKINPEKMYEREKLKDKNLCRCVLYCYRLAVYYAETKPEDKEPEKLKWGNWKDCGISVFD